MSPKHPRVAPKHWTWSIKPNHQFPSRRCSLLPVLHRLFVLGMGKYHIQPGTTLTSLRQHSKSLQTQLVRHGSFSTHSLTRALSICTNRRKREGERGRERERGRYKYYIHMYASYTYNQEHVYIMYTTI